VRSARLAEPTTVLDPRYSSPEAVPTAWLDALETLAAAELFWISTVRPDGRPHVTPLAVVVDNGSVVFCTGPDERKARNLAANPQCVLTTGCNVFDGTDIVLEGEAVPITDEARLRRLAGTYATKYPGIFDFEVRDGAFHSDGGGRALVFEVALRQGFAFAKGDAFSQTRWRFRPGPAADR
jgi:hypothetical protein